MITRPPDIGGHAEDRAKILGRLAPDLTPNKVVGERIEVFAQAVRVDPLICLDHQRVEGPFGLLDQTPVSHLVYQGVLEGEFALRKKVRLVEELGSL